MPGIRHRNGENRRGNGRDREKAHRDEIEDFVEPLDQSSGGQQGAEDSRGAEDDLGQREPDDAIKPHGERYEAGVTKLRILTEMPVETGANLSAAARDRATRFASLRGAIPVGGPL